jgi:hypothetical protein
MQKQTPYNTGKVLIGCMYKIPPHEVTPEELWIQSTLLGDSPHNEDHILACVCSIAIAFIVIAMNVYTP